MAKVKAIKRGFDGFVVREVGEEFEFEGEIGSWMESLEDDKKAAAKSKDVKPADEKPKAKKEDL